MRSRVARSLPFGEAMSDPAASRYLVVGAGGLVGRHVAEALPRDRAGRKYRRDATPDGVTVDVRNGEELRRVALEARPEVIVLAAAEAYVELCERDSASTRRVNVEPARVLAEVARASGALLVVFSSEYVFEGGAGGYAEGDPRKPLNEYGRQKVDLEDIALADGRGLVCRTSGVSGPDPARKNFVCQLVDRLRSGRPFDVPADQSITPTYAPALASAVMELAERDATGVYHVAGPRILGRLEFARLTAYAYALPAELLPARRTSELGLLARRPLRCGLSVRKLERTLGHGLMDPAEALNAMAAAERRARTFSSRAAPVSSAPI